ncbi:uncharacterized protein VTP21DRAFT_2119 [Calcarisporiella thermophila]|uniref:uncharacterized protein n=1 Tax=Calcarisporiella thermophila TaxID=911321 RepID=UPI0037444CE1
MKFATVQLFISAIAFSLIPLVSAHGRMVDPKPRLKKGDEKNDFLFALGPNEVNPCGGLKAGKPQATFQAGSTINVGYDITVAHGGPCRIELSTTGKDTDFKTLDSFDNCAERIGQFKRAVQLPNEGCEKCTLRWFWDAFLPAKPYVTCSDIRIVGGSKKGGKGNKQNNGDKKKGNKRGKRNGNNEKRKRTVFPEDASLPRRVRGSQYKRALLGRYASYASQQLDQMMAQLSHNE